MRCATALTLVIILASASAARLSAQVCDAFPSLREGRVRVSADLASYTYATALGVTLGAGKDLNAAVGVGRTRDSDLDASALDVRFALAADIPFSAARRVFLCPLAAYTMTFGPNDYLLTRQDYRYRDLALGLGFGVVAVRIPGLAVLLTAGFRESRLTTIRTDWPTVVNTYGLWTLGIGLAFDGVLTVRPSVSIPVGFVRPGQRTDYAVPFGREEGEASLGVSIGINFGKRH